MTDDQIARFADYFVTLWPPAKAWEDAQWTYWGEALRPHGPFWVSRALKQLVSEHDDGPWPPGLAAMLRAIDAAEWPLRQRIQRLRDELERFERWDEEGVDPYDGGLPQRIAGARAAIARAEEALLR